MNFNKVFTGSPRIYSKHVQECYDEVVKSFDQYEFETDRAEYYIEDLASGSYGIRQAGRVIVILGLQDEAEEYMEKEEDDRVTAVYEPEVWDDVIFPALDELTDDMEKRVIPFIEEDPNYPIEAISYGWIEGSGDFGISILIEREG